MSVTLRWDTLRSHNGSLNDSFEELCCLLAEHTLDSDRRMAQGWRFLRRGRPDAGCECTWTAPDGTIEGWQAKWFPDPLGASQWRQLDETMKVALEKQPRLRRLTVCIPQDRADAKRKGQQSFHDKWLAWVDGWKRKADRDLTIDYWGTHEIFDQLTQPQHLGRRRYFFERELFWPAWFQSQVDQQIKNAGPRYSPELRVDLPIAKIFAALARLPLFRAGWPRLQRKLVDTAEQLVRALGTHGLGSLVDGFEASCGKLSEVARRLACDPSVVIDLPDLDEVVDELERVRNELDLKISGSSEDDQPPPDNYRVQAIKEVRGVDESFGRAMHELVHALRDTDAGAARQGRLLVIGAAGTGKTHLFCDVAKQRTKCGLPTLLYLAQQMSVPEPLRQMRERTGLAFDSSEAFLGALNTAGELAGSRALILIDALNETTDDPRRWDTELPGLVEALHGYPHIALALSVRDTYVDGVIPKQLDASDLPRVEHTGFAHETDRAIHGFFEHYNIRLPDAPMLDTEFSNPLFLKLFCQAVSGGPDPDHKRSPVTVPNDLDGLVQVLDRVLATVEEKMVRDLELNCDKFARPVQNALTALAHRMASRAVHGLPRTEAAELLEDFLRSGKKHCHPLQNLLSEGLLALDRQWEPTTRTHIEIIRFGYERLGTHMQINALLDQHFDVQHPDQAFRKGTILGQFFESEDPWLRFPNEVGALFLSIPHRCNRELFDLVPASKQRLDTCKHFVDSLKWRPQDTWTPRTNELINEALTQHDELLDDWLELLLTVSIRPDHPVNADFLHKKLRDMKLPDRDMLWSIPIHHDFEANGVVAKLIRWAWTSGVAEKLSSDTARLYSLVLTWFLTSSNRSLRDQATKALVVLLTPQISLLREVLKSFANVDDPYVVERIFGVAYGCCLRNSSSAEIGPLAQDVYDHVFRDGKPPAHILIRDYARGIIECALQRKAGIDVNVERIRPPYHSRFPKLPTKDAAPAPRVCRPPGATKNLLGEDLIRHSLLDRESDFRRYIVDSQIEQWLRAPLHGPRPPSSRAMCKQFFDSLSGRQGTAWRKFQAAERNQRRSRRKLSSILAGRAAQADSGDALELHEACEVALRSFEASLDAGKRRLFTTVVQPYRQFGHRHLPRVDPSTASAWMFKRAVQLGKVSHEAGEFDWTIKAHDHFRHKVERLGKKYQWIAYYELLAMLADNFVFGAEHYGDKVGRYEGPWQLSRIRNIDPSWVGPEVDRMVWGPHPPAWWCRHEYTNWLPAQTEIKWLREHTDFPDPSEMLIVPDPVKQRRLLCLKGGFQWEQHSELGTLRLDERRRVLEVWIEGYFVKRRDLSRLRRTVRTGLTLNEWGNTSLHLPEPRSASDAFLGERWWSPASRHFDDPYYHGGGWVPAGWTGSEPKVCNVAEKYFDDSSLDGSFDGAVEATLPSKWLVSEWGLEWTGNYAEFVDLEGRLVVFDPSTRWPGPPVLLADFQGIGEFLTKTGCVLVWIVRGRKSVFGRDDDGQKAAGTLFVDGMLEFDGTSIAGDLRPTFLDFGAADRGGSLRPRRRGGIALRCAAKALSRQPAATPSAKRSPASARPTRRSTPAVRSNTRRK